MKKKAIENIAKVLPSFFKNLVHHLKNNFDERGQEILNGASGTAGIITRLFAQPLIDKYFKNLSEKRLENFGFQTYLKSALDQAAESLEEIKDDLDNDLTSDQIVKVFYKTIEEELTNFDPSDVLLIFQARYHPTVVFVKDNYAKLLKELKTKQLDIKSFMKHFNENIESRIEEEFGDDYEKHLKETEEFRLKNNEVELLWDMTKLGEIGFSESENLKYEDTFAQWKKVAEFLEQVDEDTEESQQEEQEKALKPIEKLIDEYFSNKPDNHLEKILFVVADFGKGKSVFLKYYAAKLAKEYLMTGEGLFPVYFNLRNFKNYSSEPKLGVIGDFLETKYSIKIDGEYFKKKNYVFLIDSLDESGELSKTYIDKVVPSVKSIQDINKSKFKTNRIIITSRPFDEGLENHLRAHSPHIIKNEEGREIPYFISLYGFKMEQFNEWLLQSLRTSTRLSKIQASGYTKKIINAIRKQKNIDIYKELVKNNTLSRSELRRPIFAYMIYQLIINNIDFLTLAKIGVYLSFINLLTKDAKHIRDINYRVNLIEEFEFRNILHATAALWMSARHQGKQGALRKGDICRVLDGENKGETDSQILERYKDKGVTEIQFLSHSYFGESDNILHFQHQSFAEILLAEYYMKVFIKYALDEEFDYEEARTKLMLGVPTEQTIQFLKEMLQLLRDTAVVSSSEKVIEKRKLLFPLMSSLGTQKNNKLFSNNIYYEWYRKCQIEEDQSEYPKSSLEKWCINRTNIDSVVNLAKEIIESKTNYMLTKAEEKTSLYNKEALAILNNKLDNLPPDIDRWLALLVGNVLFNDENNQKFFNSKIENSEHLFDLIRNWNYTSKSPAPVWASNLFQGIVMKTNKGEINLSCMNLTGLNFSHSYLYGIKAEDSILSKCKFNDVHFEDFDICNSTMWETTFHNVKAINGEFRIYFAQIIAGIHLPHELFYKLNSHKSGIGLYKYIPFIHSSEDNYKRTLLPTSDNIFIESLLRTLSGLLLYGMKKKLFTKEEIKSWFKYETKKIREEFLHKIDKLEEYQTIDTKKQNTPITDI